MWLDGCVLVFLCVFNQKFLVGGGSISLGDERFEWLTIYNCAPAFYCEIRIRRDVVVLVAW
jgi:hypothetical protein